MADEKDRFGEKMRLVEKAKEDIYFAAKDRELIEKLKATLKKVEPSVEPQFFPACPKCPGKLEGYSFMGFLLDRCENCGGIWLDQGELEGVLREADQSPWGRLIRRLVTRAEKKEAEGS
jgi:Zn-finger nucleic acid-binding protein